MKSWQETPHQLSIDFHQQACTTLNKSDKEQDNNERLWAMCETNKHIGDVKLQMGDPNGAESSYKECNKDLSEVMWAKKEKEHIETALLHDRLAEVYSMSESDNVKLEQSISCLTGALKIREDNLEKQHSHYEASFDNFALAHTLKGE